MLESCYSFAFASNPSKRRRFLIRLAIELGEGWEFLKPRDKSSFTCTWIYYWYVYMCIFIYHTCYVYIYIYWCIYKVGSTIPSNWLDFKSSTSTVWLIFISKWNNYSLVSMNLSGIGPPNAYSSSGVRCNILGRNRVIQIGVRIHCQGCIMFILHISLLNTRTLSLKCYLDAKKIPWIALECGLLTLKMYVCTYACLASWISSIFVGQVHLMDLRRGLIDSQWLESLVKGGG